MENKKIQKEIPIWQDKSKPLDERRIDYKEKIDKMMNPVPDNEFNPDTKSSIDDDLFKVANRKRVLPPRKLPTYGIKPKEIREGQMVGAFESKQDIYLIMAHKINDLQDQIDLLKK